MRVLRYFVLMVAMLLPFSFAQAQLSVSIGVGVGIAPPVGYVYYGPAPVCPWGYYPYYPYGCAPYGYYGPSWFISGIFIGAGPWYGGYWRHGYFGVGYNGYGYWGSFWRARYYHRLNRGSYYNRGGYGRSIGGRYVSHQIRPRAGFGMRGIMHGFHGVPAQHGFHSVRSFGNRQGFGSHVFRSRAFGGVHRFDGARFGGRR